MNRLGNHVTLNALEIEVIVDVLHQVASIAHQQAVTLVRGTGHVVAFDEGERVGVGVADLLGRQFFESHVEQPDRLYRIPTENILLGCTGEGFTGFRGAEIVLDEIVRISTGIGACCRSGMFRSATALRSPDRCGRSRAPILHWGCRSAPGGRSSRRTGGSRAARATADV